MLHLPKVKIEMPSSKTTCLEICIALPQIKKPPILPRQRLSWRNTKILQGIQTKHKVRYKYYQEQKLWKSESLFLEDNKVTE
jgi:hypothetical protein